MAKVLIAGDFCPWGRIAEQIEKKNDRECLVPVGAIVQNADYAVVNLECPVTDKACTEGIAKMGPVLSCRPRSAEMLREAGFSLVTLANNHFFDCGQAGVERTIECCRSAGLKTAGGGKTLADAEKTLYEEIAGMRIAFINVCEHEFSIAGQGHGGAAALDPIKVFYRIREAVARTDAVIVIVHGGHEGYPLPSPRMQQTYRFFADAGAAAVVNHHQHCYSGYEIYRGIPIFYGLGNFCFDWPGCSDPAWHEGYALTLELNPGQAAEFTLHPYVQCRGGATVRPMNKQEEALFRNRIESLNNTISDPEKVGSSFEKMVAASRPLWVFAPYSNRYLAALYARRLFPAFIGRKKRLRMLNMIRCEAHRDVLMKYLETHK